MEGEEAWGMSVNQNPGISGGRCVYIRGRQHEQQHKRGTDGKKGGNPWGHWRNAQKPTGAPREGRRGSRARDPHWDWLPAGLGMHYDVGRPAGNRDKPGRGADLARKVLSGSTTTAGRAGG
ncbi:hypothetical protein GGTG_06487 [Gaeumannomyces tritici R3-111a-1]|uniref:Uncharacterized protein n=1 Tax=Gaeumannomyces tritici (strain R3-111a-1) TaxID=644352 RepID=J3NYY6_GAET3|nr:hypothetical protein GGTG_06487 [Gaeumannomyces tritici R3-111a-1]EJT76569.1 hypothetical protein GGTG_06487 [Gaeumannomyces tritici R3-111a-1]